MARGRARHGTPSLFGDDEAPPAEVGSFPRHVRVALNRPVRREFTYGVPADLAGRVAPGMRVAVPFGRTRQVGVVVDASATAADVSSARLRGVAAVLDPEPVVGEKLLGLTRWMAERYACSWGEALAALLPAPLKRESAGRRVVVAKAAPGVGEAELAELADGRPKQHRLLRTLLEMGGEAELADLQRRLNLSDSPARSLERRGWLRLERVAARTDPLETSAAPRPRPELTPDQRAAVGAIVGRLVRREPATFLLQGVTGSGKTEVYLHVIERALELGRGAIVLVPEIALTPQTIGWFRARFGAVEALHSRMTDAQRLAAWRRLAHGASRVVVGARSAIFAPLPDVGVVVVDEEHEPSFKQESVPRYHARDVAVERARREEAVCVLGSATPSLESWHAAREGRFHRLVLPRRVGGGRTPHVQIVDVRQEAARSRDTPLFSRLLLTYLRETIDAGEQTILFLNRRGFVPVLWCPGCGETVRCEACDLALTWHRRIRRLVCHGCCEEHPLPATCPTCTRPGLRPFGVGSERVEAELRRLFPEARVRRMDSDTMRRREDYEEVLDAFGRHDLDVLVGTQMIAKGLDFPRVTLVGIVSADMALHLPDFRASERTFQLVAQVAGRAGRAELPGRIVVQTAVPEHAAVSLAALGDYEGFARQESETRRELGYPPHGRLVRVLFEHEDAARAEASARRWGELLRDALGATRAVVLGPAPAPISLLRGRHRAHLLVKTPDDEVLLRRICALLAESPPAGVLVPRTDVDPVGML